MDISINTIRKESHLDQDPLTELPICWHRVNENHDRKYQRKQEQIVSNIEEYEVSQCDNVIVLSIGIRLINGVLS